MERLEINMALYNWDVYISEELYMKALGIQDI